MFKGSNKVVVLVVVAVVVEQFSIWKKALILNLELYALIDYALLFS